MKKIIENLISTALRELNIDAVDFVVEHPARIEFGDYTTNAGIITKKSQEILEWLDKHKPDEIEKIEVKSGFINFYLSKEFFKKSIGEIIDKKENFGKGEHAKGFKVMVEHTDPNPFKEFHIGHLMPNVIGSTLARVFEWNGAEVKQANFQGDIGLHVAKAVWALKKGINLEKAYAEGNTAYEENEETKKEIQEINKKIYERSDSDINNIYEEGRKKSLEYFEEIYKKLSTKFDYYFFESETGEMGKKLVEENIGRVFEKSDGAIVFKGSHTRVFINSQGLPTYEAKDLGNAKNKYDKYPYDLSVIVTGNEIKDYFKVVLEAMAQVLPDLATKTKHLPHGMLRLPTGKMSSRTGDVITAEELIEAVKERTQGHEEVAIGAIKYMILRQAPGNDIVFDFEKSVSTDGDSGPYLQYAYARTNTLMDKAGVKGDPRGERENVHEVEKLLYRFPEVVERAGEEYSPHYLTLYLTELASSFNNFYASEKVIGDVESPYRLAVVEAFNTVMKNGLTILGIPILEKM